MTRLLRLTLLGLACLLAVGFLAAPASTSGVDLSQSGAVQEDSDRPSYSSPEDGDVTGENYETVSADIGAAVQADAEALRTEHERQVFELAVDDAISESAERRIAQRRLDEIESRYERLEQREQELLTTYNRQEIDAQLFLSQLATLRTTIENQASLQDQASSIGEASDRLLNYEQTLLTRAPLTDRIRAGQQSLDDNPTVYLQAGEEAVLLAAIESAAGGEETFTRQATIRSGRDLSVGTEADQFRTGDGLRFDAASSRAAELYPWIFGRFNQESPGNQGKIYWLDVDYNGGELRTYLDGATTDVIQEIHHRPLRALDFHGNVSNQTEAANVTVDRTQESGPMLLTVTDTDDDAAISGASVQVGETVVGTTDRDGELWVVEPRLNTDVRVTTPDGATVVLSVP